MCVYFVPFPYLVSRWKLPPLGHRALHVGVVLRLRCTLVGADGHRLVGGALPAQRGELQPEALPGRLFRRVVAAAGAREVVGAGEAEVHAHPLVVVLRVRRQPIVIVLTRVGAFLACINIVYSYANSFNRLRIGLALCGLILDW